MKPYPNEPIPPALIKVLNLYFHMTGTLTYSRKLLSLDGDIALKSEIANAHGITQLPCAFRDVTGDFSVADCMLLDTLKGCPRSVGGTFRCSNTAIESLQGGPAKVGISYYASDCNELRSLEGAPYRIPMDFHIKKTPQLKTLLGAPAIIGCDFFADSSGLRNLNGGPTRVDHAYSINSCSQLEDYAGLPAHIGQSLSISCSGQSYIRYLPVRSVKLLNLRFATLDTFPEMPLESVEQIWLDGGVHGVKQPSFDMLLKLIHSKTHIITFTKSTPLPWIGLLETCSAGDYLTAHTQCLALYGQGLLDKIQPGEPPAEVPSISLEI